MHETNLLLIGTWKKKILWTTSLNITWTRIIPESDLNMYRWITTQYSAYLPRASALSVMQGCFGINTHGKGNHTHLPVLPVVFDLVGNVVDMS